MFVLDGVIGCVGCDSVCECRLSVHGRHTVSGGSVNGYVQVIYHVASIFAVNISLGCCICSFGYFPGVKL